MTIGGHEVFDSGVGSKMMVSVLQQSEEKQSSFEDGELRRFTELWDVVGEVTGVLVLQGSRLPGTLELVSSHKKIPLSEYLCLLFHWLVYD